MENKNDYGFNSSAEENVLFAESSDVEGFYESTQTDCILAIAKTLIEIRDELRRLNNGKS